MSITFDSDFRHSSIASMENPPPHFIEAGVDAHRAAENAFAISSPYGPANNTGVLLINAAYSSEANPLENCLATPASTNSYSISSIRSSHLS